MEIGVLVYKLGYKANCADVLSSNRYYIYRLEHLGSGKTYIGITNSPTNRCRAHMNFKSSDVLKKVGMSDAHSKRWTMEILDVVDIQSDFKSRWEKQHKLAAIESEFIMKEIQARGRENVLNRMVNARIPSMRKVDIIRKDIDKSIVSFLSNYPDGVLIDTLFENIRTRKQYFYQSLNHLVDLGLVVKMGNGYKTNPFVVKLAYIRASGAL